MTEGYENVWLVRVRAQVMCRDEGTGGWVALGGGGLANVMVGKRRHATGGESTARPPHAQNYEYFIYGVRISDDTEVLSCTIKKDFQYNKVMPTFHHWVTDEKRFGLTFQTAADARAFDRGVRGAVQELLDGLGGAWPSLHAYKKHNPAPKEDDEENNIFECLNLPSESRSSSENSTASRPQRRHHEDITQTPILSAITLPRQTSPSAETSLRQYGMSGEDDRSGVEDSNPDHGSECPYIHLSAVHEYTYPALAGGVVGSEKSSPNTKAPMLKRDSGSLKKRGVDSAGPPPLPDKKLVKLEAFQARLRCRHCNEWYLESANRPGACEFAPDCCRTCVNVVSCIECAQCMYYHCMSDDDGDFASHPCTCGPPSESCAKRWLGLALLSILVPCLCCYAPLRCMQKAARTAHVAGGHHAPDITRA